MLLLLLLLRLVLIALIVSMMRVMMLLLGRNVLMHVCVMSARRERRLTVQMSVRVGRVLSASKRLVSAWLQLCRLSLLLLLLLL